MAQVLRAVRPAVLACLIAGGVLMGGCTSEGTGTSAPGETFTADAPVIVPGRPGEPAATLPPGATGVRPAAPAPNAADLEFVRMMVPHHTQALRMARLAPERAGDAQVREIAARISAAQSAEVAALQAWSAAKDPAGKDGAGKDGAGKDGAGKDGGAHHAMPGAVTDAQLDRLAGLRGTDFDRMFLQLMIGHHEGALQMAEAAQVAAADQLVQEMAAETAAGQSAEIGRMRDVLRRLG